MEKDLLVSGAGSSLGQKRMRADGDAKPISLELSLGAIYGGAAATSTPKVEAGESCVAIAQALSMPLPHHSAVAAALNLVAQAPGPAALLAAGAEIASSLLDVGDGASATLLASLPLLTSSCIHAAPAAALNLVAHVPVPSAGAPFVVGTGTSPAPPPRASPAARSQRQVRRRSANASPPKSDTGDAPVAPPTNGAAPAAPNPPFPWATNRVAIHRPISHLLALGITTVEGEVHCSHCDARNTVSYDIASKFQEVRDFVARNVHDMDDRAPDEWLDHNGLLRDCDACGQRRSVRPVIPPEKERINWVFLLLGQKLGLCTLDQLKFFCARTRQHRTGAKDRVLYLAYMELCNQLCPDSLFNLTAERQNRGRQYCH
uniref:Uncharacterized protein n=1 Tax=Avena sativa TaxID=4498 RepID=A0ACD5T7S3_AVESA